MLPIVERPVCQPLMLSSRTRYPSNGYDDAIVLGLITGQFIGLMPMISIALLEWCEPVEIRSRLQFTAMWSLAALLLAIPSALNCAVGALTACGSGRHPRWPVTLVPIAYWMGTVVLMVGTTAKADQSRLLTDHMIIAAVFALYAWIAGRVGQTIGLALNKRQTKQRVDIAARCPIDDSRDQHGHRNAAAVGLLIGSAFGFLCPMSVMAVWSSVATITGDSRLQWLPVDLMNYTSIIGVAVASNGVVGSYIGYWRGQRRWQVVAIIPTAILALTGIFFWQDGIILEYYPFVGIFVAFAWLAGRVGQLIGGAMNE